MSSNIPCLDRFTKECLLRLNTISNVCKFTLAFILEYSSASKVIQDDLEKLVRLELFEFQACQCYHNLFQTKSSPKSLIPTYFHDYNEIFTTIAQKFASLITSLLSENQFTLLFNHATSAIPFCYLGSKAFTYISTVYMASFEANLPSNFLASIHDFKNGTQNVIKAKILNLCKAGKR